MEIDQSKNSSLLLFKFVSKDVDPDMLSNNFNNPGKVLNDLKKGF